MKQENLYGRLNENNRLKHEKDKVSHRWRREYDLESYQESEASS